VRKSLLCATSVVLASLLVSACGGAGDWANGQSSGRGRAGNGFGADMPSEKKLDKKASKKNLPEVKVALLLPLSGDGSALGQALLDSAMMGLFDKDAATPAAQKQRQVVLIPKDSGSTPQKAVKAAQDAIAEGAQLIIGPLYSDSVKAVAPLAASKGITVLSFSNNRTVSREGVFLLGYMPEQQGKRIVAEAVSQGKKRIGVLAPDTDYGHMVAEAAIQQANNAGGEIVASEYYPADTKQVDVAIGRVAGSKEGVEPLDALLIADGGKQLEHILARLKTYGLDSKSVKLLGTGLWDDDALLARADVQGAWFASGSTVARHGFETRFMNNYGYQPQRLASLSYDAVALAATLANNPEKVDFSAAAFASPNGFAGPANGIFRCKQSGVCERGLAVIEIAPDGFKEISPSPRTFMGR
jgi:branched-chain amino acid transport system substrate-binding protein